MACYGSSAGLLIARNRQLLLGERVKGSPGYAPAETIADLIQRSSHV